MNEAPYKNDSKYYLYLDMIFYFAYLISAAFIFNSYIAEFRNIINYWVRENDLFYFAMVISPVIISMSTLLLKYKKFNILLSFVFVFLTITPICFFPVKSALNTELIKMYILYIIFVGGGFTFINSTEFINKIKKDIVRYYIEISIINKD